MTEHTFKPGDRAYHVVRREIVTLHHYSDSRLSRFTDGLNVYTEDGYGTYDSKSSLVLLPSWHPDVPERCREKKPKRRVEHVMWVNIYAEDYVDTWRSEEAARAHGHGAIVKGVEMRGSYEVDDE